MYLGVRTMYLGDKRGNEGWQNVGRGLFLRGDLGSQWIGPGDGAGQGTVTVGRSVGWWWVQAGK